ncbi:MAG TPA: nucleotidyltransferase family protein, partial [Clostridia bacterium]|nr:nucleotidyltransferase family protein [Clostridia bacterium]
KMVLHHGVDLVLELPTLYACQTAELFAAGAVGLLHQTGLVTHLAFGSEYDDLNNLNKMATIIADEPYEYKKLLNSSLNEGLSFPHARSNALKEYILNFLNDKTLPSHIIHNILIGSNSILALEYLKSLRRLKSPIRPIIIPRVGSSYNNQDMEGAFSSATSIRNVLISNKKEQDLGSALPDKSLEILNEASFSGRGPVSLNSYDQLLLGLIRRSTPEQIATWMDVEEGLENRIKEYARKASTVEELLIQTKTKRYTYTRLQRILIHGLLGITTSQVSVFLDLGHPPYLRILGFNNSSTALLKQLKERSRIPIITKPADYYRHQDPYINAMFQLEVLASDMYCLGFPQAKERIGGQEFTQGIAII